jgi:hypothetical protein
MDGCCDELGTNKHFPKFCSAKNSLLDYDLSKEKVYANLPFEMSGQFIEKFE